MASKEMTVRKWVCDGCGGEHFAENKTRALPAGWVVATTAMNSGHVGSMPKGLDLCPTCAKDPEAAIRRWSLGGG